MDEIVKIDPQHAAIAKLANLTDVSNQKNNAVRKYLTFKVANEVYGTDIDNIKEIIEYTVINRVPLAPAFIRGVSNLRGNVIPIIDLAVRLDKTSNEVNKRTCIIFVELDDDGETIDLGFVVDEVDEVMDIQSSQIEMAPQFGTDIRSDFIFGMAQIQERFVIMLSLNDVLSIQELSDLIINEQLKA